MNKRISDFPKAVIYEDQKIDVIPLRSKRSQESSKLAATVSSKLEDGDVRGAIRLAASDDTLAPYRRHCRGTEVETPTSRCEYPAVLCS